ncbi:polyphenol oxidase family protein [Breznakiella homolactica]|uniref:Polyphenol oxidase family protein n=1 Tax=Breznakiella homolactica TaxID=2798577 RepID=A0A7T8BC17_9SPIR|nr:polyphenol oxidase family protein [Breznakiella homolactica]QQO11132.1 polyphenol oxidase family protein [Breznakiella homolactica]
MHLHPFTLSFSGAPLQARFPFYFDGQRPEGISCALSSRPAGSMAYSREDGGRERAVFFRSLGFDPEKVYSCAQVHSRDTAAVEPGTPNTRPRVDGLAASRDLLRGGTALSVTVADCLPVFLWDSEHGACAVLHSGWKGTGIARNALALMAERWQTRPAAVAAVLGPCIRSCCYRVDGERARVFEDEFGGHGGDYPLGPVVRKEPAPDENGFLWYLDLQAANARILAAAGVRNLAYCEDCTFTDERLGSFRREGPEYTRMAAVIGYF